MKHQAFLAVLLCCLLISLSGCSRPASDTPAENADPAPVTDEKQEQSSEEDASSAPTSQEEEDSKSDSESEEEDKKEDEKDKEEENKQDDPAADAVQGCYKLFDSGFEITVNEPFSIYYNPLAYNMTLTIPDQPTFQGYIFYDTSEQSMSQLEDTVRQLEDSYKQDPTIENMTKEVDEQENGLFSFTFTYSAGAAEGSPAGYYFIHYQKTENGGISANLFTDRSSNSDSIRALIDSIQPLTEHAVEYSE